MNTLVHYRQREDAKAYLELMLTSIAVIVFSLFALKPTLTTIGVLSKSIEDKKQTVETLDVKIDKLVKAQNYLTQQQESLKNLEISIPYLIEPIDLVRQIEGLSALNGSYVSLFSIAEGPMYKDMSKIQESSRAGDYLIFRINLVGTYEQISNFVYDVQNLRRPVVLTALKIENSESGFLTAQIDMQVPYMK